MTCLKHVCLGTHAEGVCVSLVGKTRRLQRASLEFHVPWLSCISSSIHCELVNCTRHTVHGNQLLLLLCVVLLLSMSSHLVGLSLSGTNQQWVQGGNSNNSHFASCPLVLSNVKYTNRRGSPLPSRLPYPSNVLTVPNDEKRSFMSFSDI